MGGHRGWHGRINAVSLDRTHCRFCRLPPNRTCTFQRIRLSSARKSQRVRPQACRPPCSQVPVRLTPFAMCPAFPDSDYYEVSVAMGSPLNRTLTLEAISLYTSCNVSRLV